MRPGPGSRSSTEGANPSPRTGQTGWTFSRHVPGPARASDGLRGEKMSAGAGFCARLTPTRRGRHLRKRVASSGAANLLDPARSLCDAQGARPVGGSRPPCVPGGDFPRIATASPQMASSTGRGADEAGDVLAELERLGRERRHRRRLVHPRLGTTPSPATAPRPPAREERPGRTGRSRCRCARAPRPRIVRRYSRRGDHGRDQDEQVHVHAIADEGHGEPTSPAPWIRTSVAIRRSFHLQVVGLAAGPGSHVRPPIGRGPGPDPWSTRSSPRWQARP